MTVYSTTESDQEFPSASPSTYLYKYAEERKLACALDTSYEPAMEYSASNSIAPDGMTVEACVSHCEDLNYAYAGTWQI